MRTVKVQKSELIGKVTANRAQHVQDFKDACEGYRDLALAKIDEVMGDLKKRISELREGQVVHLMGVQFGLPAPVSYERDYDQVLAMLAMSVDDEIELEYDEFRQYVMDEWDWKKSFGTQTASYSNKLLK